MMQSSIIQTIANTCSLTLKSPTGQVFQIRNHVKMYPWRFNRGNEECYLDTKRTPYTDKHNMNEFVSYKREKKPWMIVTPKDKENRFNRYKWNEAYQSDPKEARETAQSRLSRFQDSLRDRGHARESKAYTPPGDVQERILTIFRNFDSVTITTDAATSGQLLDKDSEDQEILKVNLNQSRELKFDLIKKCIEEFNHDLPNSYLNDIESIRDLVDYYSTPIRGISPYSALLDSSDSLPPNLTLIPEPKRFDKENDDFFGGYNALPGIVSNVPGLRGAKKYPLLNQDEFQWPDI